MVFPGRVLPRAGRKIPAGYRDIPNGIPAVRDDLRGLRTMRLHLMTATDRDISRAIAYAGNRSGRRVGTIRWDDYTSRSHTTARDVVLTGSARHRSQANREEFAATYDEWGWFLAFLYSVDPDIKCAGIYADSDDFRRKTSRESGCPDRFTVSEWQACCVTPQVFRPCEHMTHGAVKLPRHVRQAESATVRREVKSGQRLSDASAAAVAAWWQAPSGTGRTFASFASHFLVSRCDLIRDAESSLAFTTTAADKAELSALIRWAYTY
jgi:hypothetical protein